MAGGLSSRLGGANKLEIPVGERGLTIFQEGLGRITERYGFRPENILVVTTQQNLPGLKAQFSQLDRKGNFIIVGERNDTAPAILAATQYEMQAAGLGLMSNSLNRQLQMVTFNADHAVPRPEILGWAIRQGLKFARNNPQIAMVGFGLEAARAGDLIGMGAIVPSETAIRTGIYPVDLFKEKPDEAEARQLYRKRAMINYGYYEVGDSFFQRAEEIIPSVLASTQRAVARCVETKEDGHRVVRLDMNEYEQITPMQLDKGFVQKLKPEDLVVVKVLQEGYFVDMGCAKDVLSQIQRDAHGNGIIGDRIHVDRGPRGSLFVNQHRAPLSIQDGTDLSEAYVLRREGGELLIAGTSREDAIGIKYTVDPESASQNMRQIPGHQNVWVLNGCGLTNCKIANSTHSPVYITRPLRNLEVVVDKNDRVVISPHQ